MNKIDILEEVKRLCNVARVPLVFTEFDAKGKQAGYFQPAKAGCYISFNLALVHEKEFKITIPHEVAHYVRYIRNDREVDMKGGRRDMHGLKWKAVMNELGIAEPKTYHTMKVKAVRVVRRWEYNCQCQTHSLTTIKHNRHLRGIQDYQCTTCKTELVFTGNEIKE